MTQGAQRSDQESRYFALLNTLAEAGHQLNALEVPAKARELLLGLSDFCRADFDKRFRQGVRSFGSLERSVPSGPSHKF